MALRDPFHFYRPQTKFGGKGDGSFPKCFTEFSDKNENAVAASGGGCLPNPPPDGQV